PRLPGERFRATGGGHLGRLSGRRLELSRRSRDRPEERGGRSHHRGASSGARLLPCAFRRVGWNVGVGPKGGETMNDVVKEEKLTTAEIAAARPRGEAIEKASDRALAPRGYEEPPRPAPVERSWSPVPVCAAEEWQ